MKARFGFPLLTLLIACPGPTHGPAWTSNVAKLTPIQLLVRPSGAVQNLKAHVVQDPTAGAFPLGNWSNGGTFQWEIRGVPSGVDGGHFLLLESGTILEAAIAHPPQIDSDSNLLQSYAPPTALPPGTTRLELKIRVTITPPNPSSNGGIAQTEIPLVIDVTAPPLAPSKDRAQEGNTVVEENRGQR